MKLAFIVERSNYYKFYGPVIKQALVDGWEVACWHNYNAPQDGVKGYLFPAIDQAPEFAGTVTYHSYQDESELLHLTHRSQPDVLISLLPKQRTFTKHHNQVQNKFVTLQTGLDTLLLGDPTVMASSDLTCLFSQFWLEWGDAYFTAQDDALVQSFRQEFAPKTIFTGFPELDGLAEIDPLLIRRRWNIPEQQPVVLLLPITLANQSGTWPRVFAGSNRLSQLGRMLFFRGFEHWPLVKNGWNDVTLNQAIHTFCQQNEAFLLVKARQKDPIRPHLASLADKIIYDDTNYPATVLEAFSIADLCIHFYSTAAIEAAFKGCFGLCIDRPAFNKDGQVPLYTKMWRHGEAGHLYNYLGVNAWLTIPEIILDLPKKSLSDLQVDQAVRQPYLEKFLGYQKNKSASKRVLTAIENLVLGYVQE